MTKALSRKGQKERRENSHLKLNSLPNNTRRKTERYLLGDDNCEDELSLRTIAYPNIQTSGVMFTVRGKAESLLFQTLEINHIHFQEEMHVVVHTKDGGYEGFETNSTAWKILSSTYVKPSNKDGNTLLPVREFVPVEVHANQDRSFYVTLDTSELRCSSPSNSAGTLDVEDENLQVFSGVSLLQPQFSEQRLEPCGFSGLFHYKKLIDCDTVVMSVVPFSFMVQHNDMTQEALFKRIDFLLKGSIETLIRTDTELKGFADNLSLILDNLNTKVSTSQFSEAQAECLSKTTRSCTALTSEITFRHSKRLNQAYLTFGLLSRRWPIRRNMNMQKSMEITYIGLIPVKTQFTLTLNGVPKGEPLNEKHRLYLETTLESFLRHTLLEYRSLKILQVVTGNVTEHVRSVDIDITVTGTVKPSRYVDISHVVDGSMKSQSSLFLEELINYRELSLSIEDGEYFAGIQRISAMNVKEIVPAASQKPNQGIVLAIFITCLVFIAVFALWTRKRRARGHYIKTDDEDLSEQNPSSEFLDEGIVSESMKTRYSDVFNRVSRMSKVNDFDMSGAAHDSENATSPTVNIPALNSAKDDSSNASVQSEDQSVETVRHSNRH